MPIHMSRCCWWWPWPARRDRKKAPGNTAQTTRVSAKPLRTVLQFALHFLPLLFVPTSPEVHGVRRTRISAAPLYTLESPLYFHQAHPTPATDVRRYVRVL